MEMYGIEMYTQQTEAWSGYHQVRYAPCSDKVAMRRSAHHHMHDYHACWMAHTTLGEVVEAGDLHIAIDAATCTYI